MKYLQYDQEIEVAGVEVTMSDTESFFGKDTMARHDMEQEVYACHLGIAITKHHQEFPKRVKLSDGEVFKYKGDKYKASLDHSRGEERIRGYVKIAAV